MLAGLEAVHAAGFTFGDLKPENVVITEDGHAKIADFGAARPFTDAARQHIEANKDAVKRLRSVVGLSAGRPR